MTVLNQTVDELQREVIDLQDEIAGHEDTLRTQSLKLDDLKDDNYFLKKDVMSLAKELDAIYRERDEAYARIKTLEATKIAENKQP